MCPGIVHVFFFERRRRKTERKKEMMCEIADVVSFYMKKLLHSFKLIQIRGCRKAICKKNIK